MSAPSRSRSRWVFALATLLVAGAMACIIGPKQDDPSSADPGLVDSGTAYDGSIGGDTGTVAADTTPGPMDGHDANDAASDATGDAASDAAIDGCADGDADACSGGADAVSGG